MLPSMEIALQTITESFVIVHNTKACIHPSIVIDPSYHHGPGIAIDEHGSLFYYRVNSDNFCELHREGGPAIEYANGGTAWYIDGHPHRLDGPAVEVESYCDWYFNGEYIEVSSQEEFERCIKDILN
jgi:hypothetical protein